jgi:hypothetical protein
MILFVLSAAGAIGESIAPAAFFLARPVGLRVLL